MARAARIAVGHSSRTVAPFASLRTGSRLHLTTTLATWAMLWLNELEHDAARHGWIHRVQIARVRSNDKLRPARCMRIAVHSLRAPQTVAAAVRGHGQHCIQHRRFTSRPFPLEAA